MKKFLPPFLLGFLVIFLTVSALWSDESYSWHDFGEKARLKLQGRRLSNLHLAMNIAAQVGVELSRQGYFTNYTYFHQAAAHIKQGGSYKGTCGDLSSILYDALSGAKLEGTHMYVAVGLKRGVRRLNFMDPNRNHSALVLVVDGKAYIFDLWVHGGEKGTFKGFGSSIWNGLPLETWCSTMMRHGYSSFAVGRPTGSYVTGQKTCQQLNQWFLQHSRARVNRSRRPGRIKQSGSVDVIGQFRRIWPAFLSAYYKGKRVEIIANATPVAGGKYRCTYKVYCQITSGSRRGEWYNCASRDQNHSLSTLNSMLKQYAEYLRKGR